MTARGSDAMLQIIALSNQLAQKFGPDTPSATPSKKQKDLLEALAAWIERTFDSQHHKDSAQFIIQAIAEGNFCCTRLPKGRLKRECAYFNNLFADFSLQFKGSPANFVIANQFDYKTFRYIVQYLKEGEAFFKNFPSDELEKILAVAAFYGIKKLIEHIEEILILSIAPYEAKQLLLLIAAKIAATPQNRMVMDNVEDSQEEDYVLDEMPISRSYEAIVIEEESDSLPPLLQALELGQQYRLQKLQSSVDLAIHQAMCALDHFGTAPTKELFSWLATARSYDLSQTGKALYQALSQRLLDAFNAKDRQQTLQSYLCLCHYAPHDFKKFLWELRPCLKKNPAFLVSLLLASQEDVRANRLLREFLCDLKNSELLLQSGLEL
jgi:hypothetical protein